MRSGRGEGERRGRWEKMSRERVVEMMGEGVREYARGRKEEDRERDGGYIVGGRMENGERGQERG